MKRFAQGSALLVMIIAGYIGVDWLVTTIKANNTVVSKTSNSTVQAAQINIFQSPYFRFQADASWREVTDELKLGQTTDGSQQYLYRSFDKNFIEHELWVTVNLPENYQLASHNIPTRVVPVRLEEDGSLTQLDSVSEPCVKALPEGSTNVAPQTLTQKDVTYYCHPNEVNDYTVTVGIPDGTNRLQLSNGTGDGEDKAVVTVTYRNITAIPTASVFEGILRNFKLL